MRRMAYMQMKERKSHKMICIELVQKPENAEHRQARFDSGASAGNELYAEGK